MPLRQPLRSVPLQTENGRVSELRLEPRIAAVAGVDDYLYRVYQWPDAPALVLYVGYYASQRTGETIHSPKNCLPGGGWQPVSAKHVALHRPDGQTALINEYIIEKQGKREIVLYWYQSHDRMIASEYWAKLYMVWDAIRLNRTDGALVRITADIAGDETLAGQHALQFAERILPELNQIIPR
jgi:EpsI family protein